MPLTKSPPRPCQPDPNTPQWQLWFYPFLIDGWELEFSLSVEKKRNCKQTLRIHVWCAYTYIYLKINQTKKNIYIYAIHRFLGDENKYTNRIYTNLIFVGEDEVELTESFPFILVGPGILIICFWEPYHELRFPPIWYLAVGRMVIFSPLLGGNQEKRRLALADLKTYCPLSIAYAYYIYICVWTNAAFLYLSLLWLIEADQDFSNSLASSDNETY